MASRKEVEEARKDQIKDGKKIRAEQKGDAINKKIIEKGKAISASKDAGKGRTINDGKREQSKGKKPFGKGY